MIALLFSWVLNDGAFCFLCHSFFFPLVAKPVEWLGSIQQETGATQLLAVAAGMVRDTRAANEPKKENYYLESIYNIVLHESSREHWGSISAKINKGPGYLKDYIGIDIHPHPWRGTNLHIHDDPDYNVHTSLCSTVYLSNPRKFYLLLGIRLAVESITSDELRVIHHPAQPMLSSSCSEYWPVKLVKGKIELTYSSDSCWINWTCFIF